MPLELATTQPTEVLQVNAYNITKVFIMVDMQEVHIVYDKGSLSNGVFTKISSDSVEIKGAEFTAPDVMSAYAMLKPILYSKIMDKTGVVGTVV